MKWQTSSTASPREVADRFAKEAFEEPWAVDPRSWTELTTGNPGTVWALFKLKGGRQVYEIEGVSPGHWTITSKMMAPMS